MCGIGGYATLTPKGTGQLGRLGTMLAMLNENRGTHSWGFTDGDAIIKDTGKISDGLGQIPWPESGTALIHTRAATTGAHTKENAHPFSFGEGENRVIGVHNGIIYNHTALNNKYSRSLAVDSMHIFAHLAERRPITDIEGYGAVVFFLGGKLFFAKFNGGSLAIADLEGGGVAWSSDRDHLKRALLAANLKHEMLAIQPEDLYAYSPVRDMLVRTGDKFKIGDRSITTYASGGQGSYHGGYPMGGNRAPLSGSNYSSSYAANNDSKEPPKGIIKIRIMGDDELVTTTPTGEEVIDITPSAPLNHPTPQRVEVKIDELVRKRVAYRNMIQAWVMKLPTTVTAYNATTVGGVNNTCIGCADPKTQRSVAICLTCLVNFLDGMLTPDEAFALPKEILAHDPDVPHPAEQGEVSDKVVPESVAD